MLLCAWWNLVGYIHLNQRLRHGNLLFRRMDSWAMEAAAKALQIDAHREECVVDSNFIF